MAWLKTFGAGDAVNWKTNLFALWLSQFLSLSAFSFSIPFVALYIKNEGIVPTDDVSFWSGVFNAAASVSLMIMSPIWGAMGDRYGRKMMLVRANLGGAFALYLMGVVDSIEALIVLRFFQGAFTGTTPAAQALVSSATPERNQGFALGVLMAAVNAGNMAGFYFGGMCAKYYGPAVSFKISGFLLLASAILVVVAVREDFVRPVLLPTSNTRSARIRRRRESITNFMTGLPLFLCIGYVAYVQSYDGPYLSLYVDHLYRAGLGAAQLADDKAVISEVYGLTGNLSLLASIGAMIGSVVVGVVMDRKLPEWIWAAVGALSGAGILWIYLSETLLSVALGRSLFLFFISGLASALVVVLNRMTPSSKRGAAMGATVSARAVGWMLAPISGALLSQKAGWNIAYGVLFILCVLLIPFMHYLVRRYTSAFNPDIDDPPSIGSVGKSHISAPSGQGRVL